MNEKRSRQYAAEILRLPEAEQAAALAQVPERMRNDVAHFVRDWPIRFRASIRASAQLLERMPRAQRVAKLRGMPLWRRRRVIAASRVLAERHQHEV